MNRIIWINNRKYYYYDTYSTYDDARKVALRYKKKSRYFILKVEKGYLVPHQLFTLYLEKIIRL